jgi:outer membrane protein assembly factor BamB
VLLFANKRGEVRAFGVADGKPRWSAKLDERVKQFCDAGELVIAVGADDVRRPIQLADGTLHAPLPAEREKPACKRLAADKPDHSSWWESREVAEKTGLSGSRHKLLDAPGGRVLAGTRNKGTAVPTLVALDAAGKERWRVDVPLDPLGSQAREPGQVAAGDTAVCAVYHVESITKPLDATCFALADGRRLWNQRIASHYASALVVTNGLLLISTYANLEARDLETGAVRWQF